MIEGPQEYIQIIKSYCTLAHLGKDCPVMNWKSYSDNILKQPGQWHFKMQKSRKITISRSKTGKTALVQGDPFYNITINEPKSLCKKGKNFSQNNIQQVEHGTEVKPAKLRDVKRLLSLHFGDNWAENEKLEFFKQFFCNESDAGDSISTNGSDNDSNVNSDFDIMEDDDVDFT